MATSGPMLVAELHVNYHTSRTTECSCGRESTLFYRCWLGIGGEAERNAEAFFCSFCAGERLQLLPHGALGKKLMLMPDPRAVLTEDERGDVVSGFSLRDWAWEEGSPALKYRVEHNQEWQKLAEFQWARQATDARLAALPRHEAPQFIERADMRGVKVKPRLTPSDLQVLALHAAQRAFCSLEPMLNASLDIVWVVPISGEARTELRIEVPVPTGSIRTLFYTLPQ